MKVLFVTWDGPQVTYLESLFLPMFVQLAKAGISFQVLQFTWSDPEQLALTRQMCEQAGIGYEAVAVWRRPRAFGALLSALVGARHVKRAVQARGMDVVMARSTLPALATMLALRNSPCRMVFDADGLPLDERVDFAGQSPATLVHRLLRDVEAQAVRRADVVLTRSAKAVDVLHARAGAGTALDKFHVVTNGRDTSIFIPASPAVNAKVRRELGIDVCTPLMVYAGSIGPQYCLNEMVRLFALVHSRRPDTHFLILSGSPEAVPPAFGSYPALNEFVTILSVAAHRVPQYLSCADLGLALRQPSFSMQAVAPIKLGEYLLSGLPVVATAGIGDTDAISAEAGMLLRCMDESELQAAADWFVDTVLKHRESYRTNARMVGLNRFSLGVSAASYSQALRGVGSSV